ncbi:hypothetical protein [Candidatus Poriferisodalis sp.]|uniref:hypothetical protein n=1 Tax=Candidatus Poriferisodalis sp. TaxID=3101277 RepID=UPI003B5C7788
MGSGKPLKPVLAIAVRRALEDMIDSRRRRVGESIAEAYRRIPETDDELRWAAESTRSMIAEEPW